jgi:hypothetical protein
MRKNCEYFEAVELFSQLPAFCAATRLRVLSSLPAKTEETPEPADQPTEVSHRAPSRHSIIQQ